MNLRDIYYRKVLVDLQCLSRLHELELPFRRIVLDDTESWAGGLISFRPR